MPNTESFSRCIFHARRNVGLGEMSLSESRNSYADVKKHPYLLSPTLSHDQPLVKL